MIKTHLRMFIIFSSKTKTKATTNSLGTLSHPQIQKVFGLSYYFCKSMPQSTVKVCATFFEFKLVEKMRKTNLFIKVQPILTDSERSWTTRTISKWILSFTITLVGHVFCHLCINSTILHWLVLQRSATRRSQIKLLADINTMATYQYMRYSTMITWPSGNVYRILRCTWWNMGNLRVPIFSWGYYRSSTVFIRSQVKWWTEWLFSNAVAFRSNCWRYCWQEWTIHILANACWN